MPISLYFNVSHPLLVPCIPKPVTISRYDQEGPVEGNGLYVVALLFTPVPPASTNNI
jgi:hypothetical protein